MPTYNQERYISQAIESVLNQKCDFKFRLIISDDCSSDATPDICLEYAKKYPETIFFKRNKENVGLLLNYKNIFDNCTSDFLTILEGDDYWCDQLKLQKQVNFFRSHPEAEFLHTDCNFLRNGKLELEVNKTSKNKDLQGSVFKDLLYWNNIHPLTVMFRKRLYHEFISIESFHIENFKTLDYPLWLSFSLRTTFYYLEDSTATYRFHGDSLSNTAEYSKSKDFMCSIHKIKEYFLEQRDLSWLFRYKILSQISYEALRFEIKYGNFAEIAKKRKALKITSIKHLLLFFFSYKKGTVKFFQTITKTNAKYPIR